MKVGAAAETLAAEVARAGSRPGARRVLLLDLDGTLAPIAATPEAARVPPETLSILAELVNTGWSVAIVSGRPAAQVRAMVPIKGVRVYGSHGVEPDGDVGVFVSRDVRRRLRSLAVAAERLALLSPGARVEVKPTGIALHDRRVQNIHLGPWRSSVRNLLAYFDLTGLEVLRGRRVIEVRPRGVHKGIVADRLIGEGGAGWPDASVVAIGDDRTDEDLFRAVSGRGLGVRVGRPSRTTAAERRLTSPAAVRRFLESLAERTTPRGLARAQR